MKKILVCFAITIIFSLAVVSADVWDGLVAYYNFDESSGINLPDTMGSDNNGTLINMEDADWRTSGVNGNSLYFDGVDEFVNISNSAVLNPANITIAFWLNMTSEINDAGLVAKGSAGGGERQYNVNWHTTGNLTGNMDNIVYSGSGTSIDVGSWYFFAVTYNGTGIAVYINGTLAYTQTSATGVIDATTYDLYIGRAEWDVNYQGEIDELGIWNRSLNSTEINDLWLNITTNETIISTDLIFPLNDALISDVGSNFTGNFSITPSGIVNFTNATFYLWNASGLFNATLVNITGDQNTTTIYIDEFTIGNYEWNIWTCYNNATHSNCTFIADNNTFTVGATIISQIYNGTVWETSNERFSINISLLAGSTLHTAKLIYNNISFTVSDIENIGNTYSLTREIDIPINSENFKNTTRNFYWSFFYAGNGQAQQNTTIVQQNVSFINLQLCNSTYNSQSLNFTMKDQITGIDINATNNKTTIQTTFNYWLGHGSTNKNYSFQLLDSETNNSFQFCIHPQELNFKTDMDMIYHADDYSENGYYLRNSTITNVSSDIDLLLLLSGDSTKFYLTVQDGTSFLDDAIVTISKDFVGEGIYKTTGIKKTDNQGEFVDYMDADKTYRFSIIKDGRLLGIIERQMSCSATPCEMTLQVLGDVGNIFSEFYNHYASNVVSNLSYNSTSKIVTYTFIDLTGLAQYFRLEVRKGSLNITSGEIICNESLLSSSGTLTCNVTGYSGDFFAYGYISRSPENVDKIISFVISTIVDSLGLMAVLFCLFFIITIVFAAATISRGNPVAIVFSFGAAVLGLKLMTILPFSWIIVSLTELLVAFLMWELKT